MIHKTTFMLAASDAFAIIALIGLGIGSYWLTSWIIEQIKGASNQGQKQNRIEPARRSTEMDGDLHMPNSTNMPYTTDDFQEQNSATSKTTCSNPHCHQPLRAGAQFCPHCGQKQPL